MKKVLLFTVIVAGLGFTSCSKSECECDVAGQTETITEDDVNGADLKESCDALNAIYVAFDSGSCKMN